MSNDTMSVPPMSGPNDEVPSTSNPHPDANAMNEYRLFEAEVFWRDRYFWFKNQGYLLRSRYHPEWIASWKNTDKSWLFCEDGQIGGMVTSIMSTIRISDGVQVILKRIDMSPEDFNEIAIGRFFSSAPQASHVDNHCISLLDVLELPEETSMFIVYPFLTDWEELKFNTVGEALEFFRQISKGLEYMHSLNVAHNDVKFNNIMMDSSPLYKEPVHPADPDRTRDYTQKARPRRRTLHPVKYYFIDYGHARRYGPDDGPPRMNIGSQGYGGDGTVPEFKTQVDCDPFPVDVYRLGNIIRESFTHGDETGDGKKRGFDFMKPLLQDMCQDDPTKRPTMTKVVSRLEYIIAGVSGWKLHSRVVSMDENWYTRLLHFPGHWARQLGCAIKRIPPIPKV